MTNVDWECIDCGIIYCAPPDATDGLFGELPEYCPDCGDHWGWRRAGECLSCNSTGRINRDGWPRNCPECTA